MKLIQIITLILCMIGASSIHAKTYTQQSRSSGSRKSCHSHHRHHHHCGYRSPRWYAGFGVPYYGYGYAPAPYWGPVMYPAPTYPYAAAPVYYDRPAFQFGLTI